MCIIFLYQYFERKVLEILVSYVVNFSGFSTRHKIQNGEVAEWSKAAVLKTVEGNSLPGFESLSLRHTIFIDSASDLTFQPFLK